MKRHLIVCGLLVVALGCGRGDVGEPGGTPADTSPQSMGKPWDPSQGTASISGVVRFVGEPPRRRPIDMGGKVECAKLHDTPVLDETVIVNEDGTLRNAFVWV